MNRYVNRSAPRRLAAAVAAAIGCLTLAAPAGDAQAGLLIDLRITHVDGVPVPEGTKAVVPLGTPFAAAVVGIDVYAVVSGSNAVNDEAFRSIFGSFRSTSGGWLGDLSASLVAPFNGTTSQAGSQVDVDGDGDFDIGPVPNGGLPASAYFLARSDGPAAYTEGAVVATDPAAEEFLIGRLTFTGKEILSEPYAFIDFVRRRNPGDPGTDNVAYANWNEDGTGTDSIRNGASDYSVSGVTIGAHIIPEPGGGALIGLGALRLLARRRRRRRDRGGAMHD